MVFSCNIEITHIVAELDHICTILCETGVFVSLGITMPENKYRDLWTTELRLTGITKGETSW